MDKAIYVAEYRNISQGIGVLDEMFKRTNLVLLYANPICIGKYLICVGGKVEDVEEAKQVAENDSGGPPLANHLLSHAHPLILNYFEKKRPPLTPLPDALGVFETRNASAGFVSMDAALKNASVELVKIWLGQMIGGKFCYVLAGSTSDVQSAIQAARNVLDEKETVDSRIIASPDAFTLDLFYR